MTVFHTVLDYCGLGFDPETKSFRFRGLFDVVWMIGTKLVHVCEGTVRHPVGWVQDCDLYVAIIIIHGMLKFHLALIHTCNMKGNALESCISYARAHRVESGVGAWYCLLPVLVNGS